MTEIPDETMETARKALCSVCKKPVVDAPGMSGIVMVNTYVPAINSRERVILCGAHGLALREFLHPDILKDPVYLAVKKELTFRW
jgi:hypothetical protein